MTETLVSYKIQRDQKEPTVNLKSFKYFCMVLYPKLSHVFFILYKNLLYSVF